MPDAGPVVTLVLRHENTTDKKNRHPLLSKNQKDSTLRDHLPKRNEPTFKTLVVAPMTTTSKPYPTRVVVTHQQEKRMGGIGSNSKY
jgi:hypothetical protein